MTTKLKVTLLCLGISFGAMANNDKIKSDLEPTDEQKIEIAENFLEEYDKKYKPCKWKITVKDDRIVLKKRWSLQRIVLFEAYYNDKV